MDKERVKLNRIGIGLAISCRRRELNLPVEDLALRVGCATATIVKIEAGKFFPSFEQLFSICGELQINIVFQWDKGSFTF